MENKLNNIHYYYEPNFFQYLRTNSTSMPRPHFHENYEIYYLISGRRRFIIEDEIYDINPGDMVLVPKFKAHIIINTPDMDVDEFHEHFLLSPKETDFPELFRSCFDTHFHRLPNNARNTILECYHSMRVNTRKNDAFTEYCNHADLIKIMSTLARLPLSQKNTEQFTKNDMMMQEAALYIKNHCSQALTLGEIAAKYHFSREYFSAIFKASTGSGFNEYLTQMRVTKAIDLLINTDLSILEISNLCGFNDSNYFSTIFKKITTFSPKKFRTTHTVR